MARVAPAPVVGMSDASQVPESHGDEESIDPSWWAGLLEAAGTESQYESTDLLSLGLEKMAKQATEESGTASLHARTLTVLARATSPMLEPDDWTSPFRPMIQLEGRRSLLPEDLSPEEIALLAQIAPLLELPTLRARAADIAWTYGDRTNQAMLELAMSSYLAVPLETDAWIRSGRDGYRRALELALRRGKAANETLDRMATDLFNFVLAASGGPGGWSLVQMSELMAKSRRLSKDQAQQIAERLLGLAGTVAPRVGRGYLRQAAAWLRGIDETQANEALETVVELYVEEAETRLRDDRGALAASISLEKAIGTLRDLPRKYRASRGLEPWLAQLRAALAEMRAVSVEEMETIRTDPVDVSALVDQSRIAVAGFDRLEALARLAGSSPLIDAAAALSEAQQQSTGGIVRIFGNITLSGDARKVAAQDGVAGRSLSDEEAFLEVVSSFTHRIGLVVQAQIYPALEVVTFEHRYDLEFLTRLCLESPTVPSGHEDMWARGLRHGLAGDFPSAIAVLVPQIEELVRRVYKGASVFTLHVGEDGIETEKYLGALLEMPEAGSLLGPNLTLELRALLCEQLGPNMRNELAHGLLTDAQAHGAAAVYAWWHCLRLVVIPYFNMVHLPEDDHPSA